MINLSLGGVRDPLDPQLDTYSPLEQAAVEYAYSKGAVVVAAVGNGPQSPATPWGFAALSRGAAARDRRQLPCVATARCPDYSNRDAVYIDVAAPGDGMFSTIPRTSSHASSGLRRTPTPTAGRSSSATRSARRSPRRRCRRRPRCCSAGPFADPRPGRVAPRAQRRRRDRRSPAAARARSAATRTRAGGRLDVASALTRLSRRRAAPARPTGTSRTTTRALGRTRFPPLPRTVDATLDYWDDNLDVYRVHLERGQRALRPPDARGAARRCRLQLWAPGTERVDGLDVQSARLAESHQVGQPGATRLPRAAARHVLPASEARHDARRTPVQYHLSLAVSRRSP